MFRLLWTLASHRHGLRHAGRASLTVLGIALGVALGYGVHLVNRAAVRDLAASVRELSGDADLEVRAGPGGFAEAVYPQVARVEGVAWVKPGLELDVGIAGTDRALRIVGIDALRDRRPELLGADKVLLSPRAAQMAPGDRLPLAVGGKIVRLEVAGIAELTGAVALTDIATAQWRLERLGELNRLDIGLSRGAERQKVLREVQALLPAGVFAVPKENAEEASAYPSRAYRVNMDVLALVALFTGGFLVFSAQALESTRRRGEHALLRVLGLRRSDITRLVLLEAAVLGALGGALGIALGQALAAAAIRFLGADLGSGAFRGLAPRVDFSAAAAALYFLAGVAVAMLGALLPAMDAAAAPPARALKAGDEQAMLERIAPAWPGVALLLAGGGLAQAGPIGGLPVFGYLAIACVLLGSVVLMPFVSQAVFRLLSVKAPVPLVLALAQLRGAPGHAAVSLAAIVASFSLMAAMAIMVASFRESVDRWLDAVLPAELYVRGVYGGDAATLPPAFEAAVHELPQVARADFLRSARILLDPARPAVSLIARDRAARAFPKVGATYERRPDDPPPAWVSEAVADLYGLSSGQKVQLPIGGKSRPFIVSGVFRDYARQHGAILIDRADYIALTGDRRASDVALWLDAGVTMAETMAALRALPDGAALELAEPGELRRLSLRIFDRSFAATYAMEAVAMLVGLFGLSSSLGAIVLARRREFGMLRHLGVTRAQIAAMLAAEGGLLALCGALAGLAAGGAISLILVYVVNRQSFNWGMELHIPVLFIVSLSAILVFLSVITAMVAGREAMGIGPVRAVREDW